MVPETHTLGTCVLTAAVVCAGRFDCCRVLFCGSPEERGLEERLRSRSLVFYGSEYYSPRHIYDDTFLHPKHPHSINIPISHIHPIPATTECMLSVLRIELAAPVNGPDPAAVELAASVDPVCEGLFPSLPMMTVPSPTASVLLPTTTSVPAAAC